MKDTSQKVSTVLRDHWIVLIVFTTTMLATLGGFFYERNQNFELNQSRFERTTQIIEDGVHASVSAYAQFLRGGVALFHSSEEVTRAEWKTYVSSLSLQENYPGIQGVSYNAILRGSAELAAFEAQVQAEDWSRFRVKPDGERAMYAPVLYLEPLSIRNERAIGFDVYSESNRAAAIDRAIATGEPSLTARITLVQEDENGEPGEIQAGTLLFLPIFSPATGSANPEATGLIVSVFRMGDFVTSVLGAADASVTGRMNVGLFDASSDDPAHALYVSPGVDADETERALYSHTVTWELYGRSWTLRSTSTPKFEAEIARSSHIAVLLLGTLISVLCTSLVWAQAERNRDTLAAAMALAASKSQVEVLLKEVNHRSKNLLALIQAIARQTNARTPKEFEQAFSSRLNALASSQDLLVRNEWKHVALKDLVRSQLRVFDDLIGNRIKLDGPPVALSSATAQTIGMALHELATNASKYGALSNDEGCIDIAWGTRDVEGGENTFEMTWRESGGPAVVAPEGKGFGSKVTGKMVQLSLAGKVEITYAASGLVWSLTCPSRKLDYDKAATREVVTAD